MVAERIKDFILQHILTVNTVEMVGGKEGLPFENALEVIEVQLEEKLAAEGVKT